MSKKGKMKGQKWIQNVVKVAAHSCKQMTTSRCKDSKCHKRKLNWEKKVRYEATDLKCEDTESFLLFGFVIHS